MPLVQSVPVREIGKIYARWEDAPIGAVVAFASPVATGAGNDWNLSEEPLIAVRARSQNGGDFLVSITPSKGLILPQAASREAFETITVASGPAVDVSNLYELGLQTIAPKNVTYAHDAQEGDVFALPAMEMALVACAGRLGPWQRYLVLRDAAVIEPPHTDMIKVGTLTLLSKKTVLV